MRNIILAILLFIFVFSFPVSASAESKITSRDYAEFSVSQAYESGYEDGYWVGYFEGNDVGLSSVESSWDDGYAEAERKYQELLEKTDKSAAYRGAFATSFGAALIIWWIIDHYKRKISRLQYELDIAKDVS